MPGASLPVIDLKDIEFAWTRSASGGPGVGDRGQPLFRNLNFRLRRGETVFLHGPSGSGKSTLLSLICGTVGQDRGRVEILGESLSDLPPRRRDRFRAERIGVIFQQFNLVPYLTALENVLLPLSFAPARKRKAGGTPDACRAAADTLLSRVGLGAPGLSDRSVSAFSVGQQQRVAAARALIGEPEVIIADEPTSSLDPDMRRDFMALLFSEVRRNGSSLVFVSHDKALRPGFDRTVALTGLGKVHFQERRT